MPSTPATPAGQTVYMQGVMVPASSVNPSLFNLKTRRRTLREVLTKYTSGQTQIQTELRRNDILTSIDVRFTGTLVVANNGGTVASTARWCYDFIKILRFTANGAANLISCSGSQLKVRDILANNDVQSAGPKGHPIPYGSLALPTETWGVDPSTAAIPDGSYDVDFTVHVPVCEDEINMVGAILLATMSTSLTLNMDLAPLSELFITTGSATVALNGAFEITTTKYDVPTHNGEIVLPDLSTFHSVIGTRSTDIQNGSNEVVLVGQGTGKSLLRMWGQLIDVDASGAASILPLDDAHFANLGWSFGGAEIPELYATAGSMRHAMARRYHDDVGHAGVFAWDFANELALRDVVDMGTANDLRFKFDVPFGVALTRPSFEYVVETLYLAGQTVA